MTRHDNYLLSADQKIPDRVRASAKNRPKGFREVRPFPKDLRAAHGFDNQSDQLTLSPLLLDTFLKLSVSILQSPDFNENTVGLWQEFFAEPENSEDMEKEIRERLNPFLRLAFRSAVEKEVEDRYRTLCSCPSEIRRILHCRHEKSSFRHSLIPLVSLPP